LHFISSTLPTELIAVFFNSLSITVVSSSKTDVNTYTAYK